MSRKRFQQACSYLQITLAPLLDSKGIGFGNYNELETKHGWEGKVCEWNGVAETDIVLEYNHTSTI